MTETAQIATHVDVQPLHACALPGNIGLAVGNAYTPMARLLQAGEVRKPHFGGTMSLLYISGGCRSHISHKKANI